MLSYAGAIKFEVRSEEARGRTLAKETMKEGRKELRKTDSEKSREKCVGVDIARKEYDIWRECVRCV